MRPTSVLQFDLRRGPACPDSQQSRYQAALEMVKWADQSGISVVGFSEHHNTEDGFLSSPLLMAAAAAQITTRVSLSVSALLLPLHDPIRVAEDIAVLDLISGGRFIDRDALHDNAATTKVTDASFNSLRKPTQHSIDPSEMRMGDPAGNAR